MADILRLAGILHVRLIAGKDGKYRVTDIFGAPLLSDAAPSAVEQFLLARLDGGRIIKTPISL